MSIFDLIFPPRCPYCGALTGQTRETCGACADILKTEPHFQRVEGGFMCVSPIHYEGPVRDALLGYKYRGCRQYGSSFSLTLARTISDCGELSGFDVFTSVPCRNGLSFERFDQTKLLAVQAARLCGALYEPLLVQTRKKQFQHELTHTERFDNVENLYAAKPGADIKGRTILLFDDIVTTGATLSACCKILKTRGAEKVMGITVAW